MAFPHAFYNGGKDASFTPLFRLLDDFDLHSRQAGSKHGRRACQPSWQPKFDVRETGSAYELHGEVPGVTKDNIHIEFSERQTMVIRGQVVRSYAAGSAPNASKVEDTAMSGAIAEDSETTEKRRNSHQATVEDETDGETTESGWEDVAGKKPEETQQVEKPVVHDNAKYWLTERSIGDFARQFQFPDQVEQDAVSANLKDGILSVIVPKAKKHEPVRINVQ